MIIHAAKALGAILDAEDAMERVQLTAARAMTSCEMNGLNRPDELPPVGAPYAVSNASLRKHNPRATTP